MWLSADWFVRNRVRTPAVPDRGSVFLVSPPHIYIDALYENLTWNCLLSGEQHIVARQFFGPPFRFIFPPINSSETVVTTDFMIRTTISKNVCIVFKWLFLA